MMSFAPRGFQKIVRDSLDPQLKRIIADVTPGGGKSLIPVIVSNMMIGNVKEKIRGVLYERMLWVVPRINLGTQAERAFMKEDLKEWLGCTSTAIFAKNSNPNPSKGNACCIATYDAITAQPKLYLHEFILRGKNSYVLVLDEFQHCTKGSSREKAIKPLVEMAGLVVLMSGTIQRNDDKEIAFIDYETQGNKKIIDFKDTLDTLRVSYPRTQALNDCAVIPTQFIKCDMVGSFKKNGTVTNIDSFHTVEDDDMPEAIFTALNTDYAFAMIDSAINGESGWRRYRSNGSVTGYKTKILIVSSDISEAKKFYNHMKSKYGDISTELATSEESEEALESIERFKIGETICLVTVAMAYEGMDVPEISHGVCLTNIRSEPWLHQVFGRGNRIDPNITEYSEQTCFWFVPMDKYMDTIIEKLKSEQEPFIRIKREVESGGNKAPSRNQCIPLTGTLTAQSIDGDIDRPLGIEATERYKEISRRLNKEYSPYDIHRIIEADKAIQFKKPIWNRPIPLTPSQRLEKSRKALHKATRDVASYYFKDSVGDIDWKRPNSIIWEKFGKGRDQMDEEEIDDAIGFLNRKFPT